MLRPGAVGHVGRLVDNDAGVTMRASPAVFGIVRAEDRSEIDRALRSGTPVKLTVNPLNKEILKALRLPKGWSRAPDWFTFRAARQAVDALLDAVYA